jgi:hypothetical protein
MGSWFIFVVENFEFEKGCSVAVVVVTGVIDGVDEEEDDNDVEEGTVGVCE